MTPTTKTEMATMKIYQAFAEALLEHGADPLFGLMGDANMLYVGDYRERGGRFVPATRESSSVGMANAWSQATGRVGFATVTCGPGVANSFTQLVEAVKARSRMVLLTGSAPNEPTHFQHLDIAMTAAAAGAAYEEVLSEKWAVRDLNRAIQRACAERRPVVLNLPQDMLLSEAGKQRAVSPPALQGIVEPLASEIGRAAEVLREANRPVVFAGRGAVESGARNSLIELADYLGAPLTTSVLAKDLFDGHPSNLGICGGLSHPIAKSVLDEADCIVVFGARLNSYTTMHLEKSGNASIIQVDDSPESLEQYLPADRTVVGDARLTAEAMIAALSETPYTRDSAWLEGVQNELARRKLSSDFADESGTRTIDPRTASIILDEVLPTDRNVVSDIGRYIHAAWPYIKSSDPRGFLTMGAFGSVGLGLAGAIGMSVGRPEQPTVCVIGDGGFMMDPAELATAVREELPVIVVIYDDNAYGFEWHKMLGFGADPLHSLTPWPDLAEVARSLGASAMTVRTAEEVRAVEPMAMNLSRPLVVVVKIDPTVDTVPH